MTNDKLTAEQAAKELGYHIYHVYRLLAQGVLRGEKVLDRVWLIPKSEVERIKGLQEDGRLPDGTLRR